MLDHGENVRYLLRVNPLHVERSSESEAVADRKEDPRKKRARARTAPPRLRERCPDPHQFLRKNQRQRQPPVIDRKEFECVLSKKRPPIPKGIYPLPEPDDKNFVKENVNKALKMPTKFPVPATIVSCRGERQPLAPFLEGKKLVESESFGIVPKYLKARRKKWNREEEGRHAGEKATEEQGPMPGFSQVTDEERQSLLKGLKERWKEVNNDFQVLPVLCDTTHQIKRKIRLEKELKLLEKDIQLIENNPYIFIDTKNQQIQARST